MKKNIIGREKQIQQLERALNSPNPELIAVYGRRRVGKTFLIKEYFNNKFDFYATGIYKGKQADEITAFCHGFQGAPIQKFKSWIDVFFALKNFLSVIKKKKIIVFLDELPWFDIPPGSFLKAFEWFWNSWGSTKKGLKLIVCGSSTSWMINKFISSKGGLYNRTTTRIYLPPFNLKESEALLKHRGLNISPSAVLDTFMVFGGIPYYLSLLDAKLSLTQNIDNLFFSHNAVLKEEYNFLLQSLFKDADYYKQILNAIGSKNKGVTRNEIISLAKITDNGTLSKALKNLILSDFIREYGSFGKKKKESLFQLTDPFLLFAQRFVTKGNTYDSNYWKNLIGKPQYNAWKGIAFEEVCLLHSDQIKKALGIEGLSTTVGSWFFKGDEYSSGAQIDLLIDRTDNVINICEMKYSDAPYEITKALDNKVRERNGIFRSVTKTNKAIWNVIISPFGIKPGKYRETFSITLDINDLIKA